MEVLFNELSNRYADQYRYSAQKCHRGCVFYHFNFYDFRASEPQYE